MMRMLALAYLLAPGSSHASHTSVPAPGAAMVLSAMPLRVWGTPSQSTAWWVGAVAGVVLRGGADDHFSEDPRPSGPQRHVVPSMYESLDECIHDVRTGDTIFLQVYKCKEKTLCMRETHTVCVRDECCTTCVLETHFLAGAYVCERDTVGRETHKQRQRERHTQTDKQSVCEGRVRHSY